MSTLPMHRTASLLSPALWNLLDLPKVAPRPGIQGWKQRVLDHELHLSLAAPGLQSSDVSVELVDQFLIVQLKPSEASPAKEWGLEQEAHYRFHLRRPWNLEGAKATVKDGILTIHVPKLPDHEYRKSIVVQSS
jgi:HSP20 family molecular chaperone IbpA